MTILPVGGKVLEYVSRRGLSSKFDKQLKFLGGNPRHPSLNMELLEPKDMGIYNFRVDRKYRALFIFRPDKQAIEVLAVTDHYK